MKTNDKHFGTEHESDTTDLALNDVAMATAAGFNDTSGALGDVKIDTAEFGAIEQKVV